MSSISNMSLADWIALVMSNFGLSMFILALIFIIVHKLIVGRKTPGSEVVYRWMAFLALGFTGIYAFVLHVFFPELAATAIGWQPSPFQFEVGMADLALGVLGILSYKASYGFRLATVIAAVICFWGDAIGHVVQMVKFQNYSVGNAGSWFWMDIIIPLILIICIVKLRPERQ